MLFYKQRNKQQNKHWNQCTSKQINKNKYQQIQQTMLKDLMKAVRLTCTKTEFFLSSKF